MTDFRTFLIAARPLYIDGAMKVNFTVDELVKFVEDYMKDNQPIVTVEMHEPDDFEDDDNEFQCCDNCDLPDACCDFGCAIKAGIKEDPSF